MINMITPRLVNIIIRPTNIASVRSVSLSAVNYARKRAYRVPEKKGFHNREDVNYDIPKRGPQWSIGNRFRYTALEEVKMEDGPQRSLVEPTIDHSKPPHKFHVVTKIRATYGETYFVREAMEKLGFISGGSKQWNILTVIVKNVPSVNKHLWVCKHMVQIKPLTFVDGVPSLDDIGFTELFPHNGHLTIGDHFHPQQMNVSVDEDEKWPVDMNHIVARLHADRTANRLHAEYFPTKYNWYFGQDLPGVKLIQPANPEMSDTHLEDL